MRIMGYEIFHFKAYEKALNFLEGHIIRVAHNLLGGIGLT